jgi:hypothetical protein
MPATAARDNETLDHLLSVVDDDNQYKGSRPDSKSLILRQVAADMFTSWRNWTTGPRARPAISLIAFATSPFGGS